MNAVITGATKGIGRAVTEKFASEGYDVAICARTRSDVEKFEEYLSQKYPDIQVYSKAADMSKKAEVLQFAGYIKNNLGAPDVLVNNAGLFLPGQIYNEEDGVLEKLIDTNLYSAYHLTRALVGDMIKAGKGHIVNMCSIASFTAYEHGGSYAISKFAMLGFSKSLRQELKEYNIKVISVMPGATYTPSWEEAELPESRFIKPEDVAEVVYMACTLSNRAVMEEVIIRPQLGDI